MTRALRLIVYFTSILPDKFLSLHFDHPVYDDIMRIETTKLRGYRKKKIAIENFDPTIFKEESFWLTNDTGDFDHLFDDIFNKILADNYLQSVFPKGEEQISHKEFVKRFVRPKLNGNKTEWSPNWFFSPRKVNTIFKQYQKELSERQLIKQTPEIEECFEILRVDWNQDHNSIISLD